MGKGSKRRPAAIDERTWAERWASINWNADNDDTEDPPPDDDEEGDRAVPDVSGGRYQ